MKLNTFILAAAFSLGVASLASAATTNTVYVAGSSAFRSSFQAAAIASGVVFSPAPQYTVYQGGTSNNNAGNAGNYMAFVGTPVGGGNTLVLQCKWTGSEAGILNLASNVTESFMDPSLFDGNDHGTNLPSLTTNVVVDLAMADNAQKYSRTTKPILQKGAEVGVVTFKWVRNPGWWTGTNVTDSEIRQALAGSCPLAVFSGNSNDVNSYVYVSGRDNSSGTRVNAFGDVGYGILSIPHQIEMTSAGVMTTNIPFGGSSAVYQGDFGFSSGGSLAATLGAVTTNAVDNTQNGGTGYSVIAYLSVGDAATAVGNGATELAYDGVPFSVAAVKEGTYPFWGNEYIYENPGDTNNAIANTVFQEMTNGIPAHVDGTKAISLSSMDSQRLSGPVADPTHN